LLGALPGRVGLRKQPAGVERDDVDIEPCLANVMEDDLILEAEACREGDRARHVLAETHQAARNIEPGERAIEARGAVGDIARLWRPRPDATLTVRRENDDVVRPRFESSLFHGEPRL
jgi:hypothetical protein